MDAVRMNRASRKHRGTAQREIAIVDVGRSGPSLIAVPIMYMWKELYINE